MLRLAAVLYILVASAVAGAAVIAVLSLDMRQGWQIATAFGTGLVIALPIAAILARHIYNAMQGSKTI
jgi:threonine/homoserine/homoserine lactone efflux protein